MPEMKQDTRVARLKTPLGADTLALTDFGVTEGLSELFEISIGALSRNEDIDFNGLIGQSCTITIDNQKRAKRHFNGILVGAEWHGQHDKTHFYRLTLRPWLWLLSRVSDCRIFHEKSAVDIIREVFSKRGFNDFRFATTQSYPKIEYCVQYRETDLNFVLRLMEEFGIYYFFEHSDSRHTLVLADSKSSHKPCEHLASVAFQPQDAPSRHDGQWLDQWVSGRSLRSGKAAFNDYNFKTPTANLLAQKPQPESYTHGTMELYDYPGRYPVQSEGEDRAKVRVEAEQAMDRRRSASGDAPNLVPGGLVTLTGHVRAGENKEYLVVRCRHTYREQTYRSGAAVSPGSPYSGAYEVLPADRRFRALPTTPKPIVHGPQTAVVTGKSGEEIDVDEYGRILVRFHWDRDKGQSCRVRVAQIWAGKSWGGQVIPRIGQEVIVEFLEGDPDRPVVTGTVWNADNMPAYTLPDNKTMSGVKSNSSKGGGGYNEFVFEDKKMSEKIRMHAEKDHEVKIRNKETVEIGEAFMEGGASRQHKILLGDDDLKVLTGNQNIMIAMKQDEKIGMSRDTLIGMKDSLTVGISRSEMAAAAIDMTAGGKASMTAGGAIMLTAGAAMQFTAGGVLQITAPMITITGAVKITGPLFLSGPPIILPF